ncbi:hypothetical protein K3495_g4920 [Podosphaera aphanis]|nr:hypothetical protein K3495_g4920 [Podosphaera aphanis]
MDFNFEEKVDLSTLANAPAEVRDIFHELFGLINSHFVAQSQTLHTLQKAYEERNDEAQKLRSAYERQKKEISSLKSQLSAVPRKMQKTTPVVPQATVLQQKPTQYLPAIMIFLERSPSMDPFAGDQRDVVKRHNEYNAWKFKLISKWNISAGKFDSEFKKICDAINWLKGDTYTRLQSKIAQFFSNTDDLSDWP